MVWSLGGVAVLLMGAAVPSASAVDGPAASGAAAAATVKVDVGADRACSGALVDARWVVTAKSCFAVAGVAVADGPPKVTTRVTWAGTGEAATSPQVVAVDRLVVHPDRDVVLAHLASGVDGSAAVKVAATAPVVGEHLTVAGYGRTSTVLVPDTAHAATYTVTAVTGATADIEARDAAAAICKGDAGGPTLRSTADGVELVAIHHTAYQGGCLGSITTNRGATETRVDDLRDWIARTRNAQGTDFDGDGTADVFWSRQSDGKWRVSYGGTTTWHIVNSAGGFPTGAFRFGDFDGDGRDDVFLAPGDGRWLVSNGGSSGWRVANAGVPNDHLAFVDLAGDGRTDVFRVDAAGLWWVSDDATKPFRQINGAPGIRTDQLRFGDFNGDRKDDVFFAPGDGRWIVSWGGTQGWQVLNAGSMPSTGLDVADMTGDGKADVFWVDPATGRWHISDGGTGPLRHVNGAPGIGVEAYQLADLTGDGKADVFLANSDGRWLVSDAGVAGWRHVGGDPAVLPDRPAVR